ncbi:MAG: hypothetical protein AB1791_12765 [Chloroflexota bacterium]
MATIRHVQPRRNLERYGFLLMRLSGVGLLLLAVGHMLLQHIFRDVHNLTLDVVRQIWAAWGWRAYDLFLLAFAISHGYYGLRTVLVDYIHNPKAMKALDYVILVFGIVTIIWSAVAIFSFNPEAAVATR